MNKYYAGIGSRQTPLDILALMYFIAECLAQKGYICNSGSANGADTAFELGAKNKGQYFLPWYSAFERNNSKYQKVFNWTDCFIVPSLTLTPRAEDIVSKIHPNWERLTRGPRALHTRNVFQVLGKDLHSPVQFVLCYTSDGASIPSECNYNTGGTATAIKIANVQDKPIPVFNLAKLEVYERQVAMLINEGMFTSEEELKKAQIQLIISWMNDPIIRMALFKVNNYSDIIQNYSTFWDSPVQKIFEF